MDEQTKQNKQNKTKDKNKTTTKKQNKTKTKEFLGIFFHQFFVLNKHKKLKQNLEMHTKNQMCPGDMRQAFIFSS